MISRLELPGIQASASLLGLQAADIGKAWRENPDALASMRFREGHVVEAAVTNFHLRTADASIVVDPREWTAERFDAQLAEMGVDPLSVTHVLITHGHIEHSCGAIRAGDGAAELRFPNALHCVNALDWSEGMALQLRPAVDAGRLRLVEGDSEVERGVFLLHTGGETPGHSAVRASADGATVFHLGDLVHLAPEFEWIDWGPRWTVPEELVPARRRLFSAAAETGAVVTFAHAPSPPWGTVIPTKSGGWRWQQLDA